MRDDVTSVTLSHRQRLALDSYLAPFCAAAHPSARDAASRCRMALNTRAVQLGVALDPEGVLFLPDELEFLQQQVRATRDAMDELIGALELDSRAA